MSPKQEKRKEKETHSKWSGHSAQPIRACATHTVQNPSTLLVPKAVPRIGIGGKVFQPSGSSDGPGIGLFDWYARRRRGDGGVGRVRGINPNCVPILES